MCWPFSNFHGATDGPTFVRHTACPALGGRSNPRLNSASSRSDASHGSRISVASSPASTRKLMDPHAHVLEPPTAPFHSRSGSAASLTRESGTSTPTSLSVNYLPSKFAPVGGARRRAGKGGAAEDAPKRGGGREAFRAGENRMPDATDEDYDGVQGAWFGKTGGHTKPRMKWTRFKWILFVANLLVRLLVVCQTY